MEFLIVIQTHTLSSNEHQKEQLRYCGTPKPEVTKRCVRSLINSIQFAQARLPKVKFITKIFDDHSDENSVGIMKRDFANSGLEYDFEELSTRGIMPSILRCYEFGRDHGKDLVYFVQDDYLYFESCIFEMVVEFERFSQIVGQPISIYPFNDPYRYLPHNLVEKVHVFQGVKRYWRTNYHPSCCFMVPHKVLLKEWDLFHAMGTSIIYPGMEQNTIGQLFISRNHILFTPIPSLSLHMQLETERDPFIEWQPLWEKFSDPNYLNKKVDLPPGPILLNVGCGRVRLNMQNIRRPLTEVRVDSDSGAIADVRGTIQDLSAIPDMRISVIYASHVLEHVLWSELMRVMREFIRVLEPGGMAVVAVPNLAAVADFLKDESIIRPVYECAAGPIGPLDMIYGFRQATASGQEGMLHKIGFNKFLLQTLFVESGWAFVEIIDRGSELVALAISPGGANLGLPSDVIDFLNL